jgi:hypothetical protein
MAMGCQMWSAVVCIGLHVIWLGVFDKLEVASGLELQYN